MTPAQFHLWVGDQLLLVCFVGLLVILFVASLERIARRRGWRFVLRLMPAIAVELLDAYQNMPAALSSFRGEGALPPAIAEAAR